MVHKIAKWVAIACVALIASNPLLSLEHRWTPLQLLPCVGTRTALAMDLQGAHIEGNKFRAPLHLGYRFSGCFGEGRWAAYYNLIFFVFKNQDPIAVAKAKAINGGVLPEPPRYLTSMVTQPLVFQVEWLWLFLLVALGTLSSFARRELPAARTATRSRV